MHSPYLKQRKAGRRGVAMHQPWCRISAVLCVQSVYTTTLTSVSACIHRQMVGTHVPAACSNVAANTTAVPCTIGVHTPTILLGCLPYASSFKLTYALVCSLAAKLYENLTYGCVKLQRPRNIWNDVHQIIYIYIIWKIAIQLTSVGLTHARPNQISIYIWN